MTNGRERTFTSAEVIDMMEDVVRLGYDHKLPHHDVNRICYINSFPGEIEGREDEVQRIGNLFLTILNEVAGEFNKKVQNHNQ